MRLLRYFGPIAANTAVLEAANITRGLYQEMNLGDGEKESSYLFTRYGEYPVTIFEGGKPKRVIQVVDREAANQMREQMHGLVDRVATFFKGIPIYEGHSDDPAWRAKNPGYKPAAVGRIKEIVAGNDGIEVRSVFNSRGVEALSGDAPAYSGHSPRWRMREIPGRPGFYRPYLLLSDALTNEPNIPDSVMGLNEHSPSDRAGALADPETETETHNDTTMNPELLKRLGLKPEADQTEIDARVATVLNERDTAQSELTTARSNLTAANERVTALETEVEKTTGDRITIALNDAVEAKRITEADKPTWEPILKADFAAGKKALDSLKGATALNEKNHLGDQRHRAGEGAPSGGGIIAMNEAVRAYAKEHDIDVSTPEGWDRAWTGAKAEKPDVFKPAKAS